MIGDCLAGHRPRTSAKRQTSQNIWSARPRQAAPTVKNLRFQSFCLPPNCETKNDAGDNNHNLFSIISSGSRAKHPVRPRRRRNLRCRLAGWEVIFVKFVGRYTPAGRRHRQTISYHQRKLRCSIGRLFAEWETDCLRRARQDIKDMERNDWPTHSHN